MILKFQSYDRALLSNIHLLLVPLLMYVALLKNTENASKFFKKKFVGKREWGISVMFLLSTGKALGSLVKPSVSLSKTGPPCDLGIL